MKKVKQAPVKMPPPIVKKAPRDVSKYVVYEGKNYWMPAAQYKDTYEEVVFTYKNKEHKAEVTGIFLDEKNTSQVMLITKK